MSIATHKLWITGKEAAHRLGIAPATCYGWLASGEIPAVRSKGGRWYVSVKELDRWASERARLDAESRKRESPQVAGSLMLRGTQR